LASPKLPDRIFAPPAGNIAAREKESLVAVFCPK
jgi:hypothetical protein